MKDAKDCGGFWFREKDHTFWTKDGDPVPGVSAILRDSGFVDDRWYTPEHAKRGHYVHDICHYIDDGTLKDGSVDGRLCGYEDAYKAFKSENKGVRVVKTRLEKPVFNKDLRFAGIPDSVPLVFGKRIILDWKSGTGQDWHWLQVAGYAALYGGIEERWIVYLKNNGTYRLFKDDRKGYHDQVFMSALNCYWWRHG